MAHNQLERAKDRMNPLCRLGIHEPRYTLDRNQHWYTPTTWLQARQCTRCGLPC